MVISRLTTELIPVVNRDYIFTADPMNYYQEQEIKVDASNFSDSWNLGFGIEGSERFVEKGEKFDILNNDYIQLIGLELVGDKNGYRFYDKSSHQL